MAIIYSVYEFNYTLSIPQPLHQNSQIQVNNDMKINTQLFQTTAVFVISTITVIACILFWEEIKEKVLNLFNLGVSARIASRIRNPAENASLPMYTIDISLDQDFGYFSRRGNFHPVIEGIKLSSIKILPNPTESQTGLSQYDDGLEELEISVNGPPPFYTPERAVPIIQSETEMCTTETEIFNSDDNSESADCVPSSPPPDYECN